MTDALRLSTAACVKLPRGRFLDFSVFQYKVLVLGSISKLSDARQHINLESWLGGYGLVGELVVLGCVHQHHPPPTFPCITVDGWVGGWMGWCAGFCVCDINISISV